MPVSLHVGAGQTLAVGVVGVGISSGDVAQFITSGDVPAEVRTGHEIRDEDVARLSPLKHRNLNCLGRYSFTVSTPAAGRLRPLRDLDAVELDDDDDGQEE